MAAIKEPAVPNGPKEIRKSFQYPGDIPLELYDWVPAQQEGFKEKLIKKLKQNPFVPIGKLRNLRILAHYTGMHVHILSSCMHSPASSGSRRFAFAFHLLMCSYFGACACSVRFLPKTLGKRKVNTLWWMGQCLHDSESNVM